MSVVTPFLLLVLFVIVVVGGFYSVEMSSPTADTCLDCTFDRPQPSDPKTAIWVDTDMDFDDILALLSLFSEVQEREIFLVSTTGCGAAHINTTANNLMQTLAHFPTRTIRHGVVIGTGTPTQASNVFPFTLRVCADYLYHQQSKWPAPRTDVPIYYNTTDYICAALQSASPASVSLLSLGGGTNPARVRRQCASAFARAVVALHVMGGTEPGGAGNIVGPFPIMEFDIDGDGKAENVSSTPYENYAAEWNVFVDPWAFHYGIIDASTTGDEASGIGAMTPVLVSLSATDYFPLTEGVIDHLRELAPAHTAAQAALDILTDPCVLEDPTVIYEGESIWDVLAAMAVLDDSLICTRKENIAVDLRLDEGNDTSGAIVTYGTQLWPYPAAVPRPVHVGTCAKGSQAFDLWYKLLSN